MKVQQLHDPRQKLWKLKLYSSFAGIDRLNMIRI